LSAAPRVLITDGQDRSSLAGLRSLRSAGYAVDAVAYGGPAATHWSRFCGERHTVTDPRHRDGARFVEGLKSIAQSGSYEMIVTGSDASLLAISRHRGLLEPFVELALPTADAVERCVSKQHLVELAATAGLGSPETEVCTDAAEAMAAGRRFGYPVLLKPQKSVFRGNGDGLEQPGSSLVSDDASLLALLPDYGMPFLVERFEAGKVLSFSGVAADGRLLAYGMSRYERTWPSEAGMASFAETVTPPQDLCRKVDRLLAELGWQGVFELELIQREDASFAAIDFNPRLFGSLELITRAGAPLTTTWCDWVLGMSPPEAVARPGYRYRWEEGEARYFWQRLRRGQIRSALAVLRPRRRMIRSFFRLTDPAPLLARLLFLLNHRYGG
jgi:predicted ATP-grasp superfamily ATP-dependent carboligase